MLGDEFDFGKRLLLAYGHELGHALEASSHFRIPHGIGVVIGIIFANLVSYNRKWIEKSTFEILNNNLLLPNIQMIKIKADYFNYYSLLEKMKKDKKRDSENLN